MTTNSLNINIPIRWVLMGVSGCGKTEIGQRLARRCDLPYIEGDHFHSSANIEKMESGIPLGDLDRAEWLKKLQLEITKSVGQGAGAVLTCSALKRSYRDFLRAADPTLVFVHLTGDRDLIAERMRLRAAHYMPLSLLDSQLLALEQLAEDERGMNIDIRKQPDELVTEILQARSSL